METVNIKINHMPLEVPKGTKLIEAAKMANVKIPKLCYHSDLPSTAACGICVVRVEGSNKLLRSCATEAADGMSIITHDAEIVEVRKTVIEMILSTHPNDCLACPRNRNCELQQLAAEFGVRELPFEKRLRQIPEDSSTPSIVLNPEKCVSCGRCATVCQQVQNVWALEFLDRGEDTRIAPAADVTLDESPCIKCGQCSAHCPVGAIFEKDDSNKVWEALNDPDKHCVVQIAPAVRVAIGDDFGYGPGELLTGKTYAALRRLGFDAVFDTNFSADLTIMEEGSEFVERFAHNKGEIPQITSCCPAWVDYMEKYYPEMIPNFSTAKSPMMMMGSMVKTYYAEKKGLKKENIYMVSIMPCTAKKFEIERSEQMFSSGVQDVDVSLTTRELGRMIKSAGLDFRTLPEEDADSPLGIYSGAGTIFGVTGGVMEAALRTAYHLITKKELDKVEFDDVRGLEGVKSAAVDIEGTQVRIAVAHSMGNIAKVMDQINEAREKGEDPPYHFIEVMACRGGCISGGGQPYGGSTDEARKQRTEGIYKDDKKQTARCSHNNPAIKELYESYLGKPLGEKSHKLLHVGYKPRPIYRK